MDAFEQVVSELFFAEGYWVETSVKVELTKAEKKDIGRPSSPRWEIDVVAYSPRDDEVLAIECKSFLDSRGVNWAELQDGHESKRYKLFREPKTRGVVLGRLKAQLVESGRCAPSTTVRLAMAAAKVKAGDGDKLATHFAEQGWRFFGPGWLRERLHAFSQRGYSNQVTAVVAKVLLRTGNGETAPGATGRPRGRKPAFKDEQVITLLVGDNPKKPGSQAYQRFARYFELERRTVAEARERGLRSDDFSHDVARGFISIE